MHIRRGTSGGLDPPLHRLLFVPEHRAEKGKRRNTGRDDLLISDRALVACASRAAAPIARGTRPKWAAPLLPGIVYSAVEHGTQSNKFLSVDQRKRRKCCVSSPQLRTSRRIHHGQLWAKGSHFRPAGTERPQYPGGFNGSAQHLLISRGGEVVPW